MPTSACTISVCSPMGCVYTHNALRSVTLITHTRESCCSNAAKLGTYAIRLIKLHPVCSLGTNHCVRDPSRGNNVSGVPTTAGTNNATSVSNRSILSLSANQMATISETIHAISVFME